MPYDTENPAGKVLDLDELLQDLEIPDDTNPYIEDKGKAVELLAKLIQNDSRISARAIKKIRRHIDEMFAFFEDVGRESGLEMYEQFLDLCARLSAQQKIRKIQDKVVIGFGGAFSSGKSRFINAVSGIGTRLPVDQNPTTSIPTYIIKSDRDELQVNSKYGYDSALTAEEMDAMTHKFYDTYRIGFSAFVDSIIVESKTFSLPREIALLDTPGYTKYDDEKSSARLTITDRRQAYEQLRASDYLIWLTSIQSGDLTQEDITFIEELRVKTPILIVFTKADLVPESSVEAILVKARETVERTGIDCFGITAYSAQEKREYGNTLITQFINYAITSEVRGNDILLEFDRIEREMRERIKNSIAESKGTADRLFTYITQSSRFMDIRSLVALWGRMNQQRYQLNILLKNYETAAARAKREIINYIGQGD